MLVVATGENHIKHYVMPVHTSISENELNHMNEEINTILKGKTRDDMTDDAIRDLALVTREHQELLKPCLLYTSFADVFFPVVYTYDRIIKWSQYFFSIHNVRAKHICCISKWNQ